MTRQTLLVAAAGFAVAAALGFGVGRMHPTATAPAPTQAAGRPVLYWYDPMTPAQHFDKPGKSPFMDMQLVPKYAGDAPGQAGVQVDPARVQNLGVRVASAERGRLPSGATAAGVIDFDGRDVAVVQARAAGFVQRVYGRAPGDIVAAGAPLADVLIPEWAGAQGEYLAMRRTGDTALIRAARQRLQLLGMPPALVGAVERSGQVRNTVTVAAPTGGVIKTLMVRNGMTLSAGQTLAEINGLGRVWLNAAVPEALAGQVRVGETVTATLAAYPGQTFAGRVAAILPQAQAESRTLTARVELPNPGGRLRPGMFASLQFGGQSQAALLVPSEAVIRTGKRTLVMLARPGGRFEPAEVRVGGEADGQTEVLAGLSEGEKVVASGQFLLDSEASLSGVQARPIAAAAAPASKAPALYDSVGRIEQISPASVTLSHEPVPAIGWPAMTMQFHLADPALARGLKAGDQVAFSFDQPPAGPTVRRMDKAAAR
ncbi:efflux RND transporter periplasmic adaptor subunit [Phenylobacterium hankyongense]|uniref:Efflux RND transporter periplasmic adaptor subunit n=1 Tax=Phenylobacterium hankyongense TaxID=1813876 RepID=A0A328AZX8_9CAUL|nr:efflux RND transporter periplasmic adaptor subunit [Phenylobacterium hankyongense]RAK60209.1 efflux RND transporter periplasmic adaptor subunit [Phenylobacterium hankyongense]